jgi:ankyrin repeat protein
MMTARNVPIIDFVSQGAIDDVRRLIKNGCNVDEKDYSGNCAVIVCVERNDINIMHVLIQENANLDVLDPLGCPALKLAEELEHYKIAQLIKENLNKTSVKKSQSDFRANGFDGLHFHGKRSEMYHEELKSEKQQDELNESTKSFITPKKE